MARRGSAKARSVEHEEFIAQRYRGTRSVSSGGAATDRGDVRTFTHLIECKQTGELDKPRKQMTVKLEDLEKIWDEARSEGRDWAAALRIYAPDSPLASRRGYVDLMLRPVSDDVERERG